jgi:multisubunit Na+/H+ antiporter MnhE subunit
VFFTWMISLMPGTASVNLHNQTTITVHVVDTQVYNGEELRRLEDFVAGFMGAHPDVEATRSINGSSSSV